MCPAAPNILAGLTSKGLADNLVGIYGALGPAGFTSTVFAASKKSAITREIALPTNTLLGVSP